MRKNLKSIFLERAAREKCSVKWILVAKWEFDVGQREPTEQLDLGGLPDAC